MDMSNLNIYFFGYIFAACLFAIVLCVLIKMWIHEMFSRYDNQEIIDSSNMFDPFRLSRDTKASICINYLLFSTMVIITFYMSYEAVSKVDAIIAKNNEIALKNDADSLRYQLKLYKGSNPNVSQLGNKECVQKDGTSRGNDNENQGWLRADGIERGLH